MERSCPRPNGHLFSVSLTHLKCNTLQPPHQRACGRSLADEGKFRVNIRIVRLLLEDEDSVQAETYYNRAASLSNSTSDRETQLQFKLCQARISDYARKFLEAAMRYHELSWLAEIDEEERKEIL